MVFSLLYQSSDHCRAHRQWRCGQNRMNVVVDCRDGQTRFVAGDHNVVFDGDCLFCYALLLVSCCSSGDFVTLPLLILGTVYFAMRCYCYRAVPLMFLFPCHCCYLGLFCFALLLLSYCSSGVFVTLPLLIVGTVYFAMCCCYRTVLWCFCSLVIAAAWDCLFCYALLLLSWCSSGVFVPLSLLLLGTVYFAMCCYCYRGVPLVFLFPCHCCYLDCYCYRDGAYVAFLC